MMPGSNPFQTHVFGAPADGSLPECHPLEVTAAADETGHPVRTSAWEPSAEELEALQAGARVWVTTWGAGLPPVAVTVGDRPPYLPPDKVR